MTFFKLTIAYFRSFREEQTFWFPRKAGFYFLTGRNKVNPELGANATGKSSLFDALSWVCYGRTARSLKGTDSKNWDEESGLTSGSVDVELGGRYYTLSRTQSPNSLTIRRKGKKPRTVDQPYLDRLLGMTHAEFLAVVLMGQFGTFFFDLSPTEKLAQFSHTLNLSYWQERVVRANRLADEVEDRFIHYDKEKESCTAKIQVLRKQVAFQQKNTDKYMKERQVQLEHIREDVVQAESKVVEARKSVGKAVAERGKAEDWKTEQERSVRGVDDNLKQTKTELEKLTTNSILAKSALESLERQLGDAQKAVCPTCKQPVKNRLELVNDLSRRARDQRTAWFDLRDHAAAARKKHDDLKSTLDSLLKQLRDAEAEVGVWKGREGEARSALKSADARLSALLERRAEISGQSNPHTESLESLRKLLVEAIAGHRAAARQRRYQSGRLRAVEEAVKHFKNLRLWLVEEAMQQLEIEVGNSLMQLGLNDWRVTFDIERATKAGGVSRGFSVFIQAPGSPERVRWEAWCGGETQRLRIAGAIGLANLIRSRSGIDPNIEVWDEPTSNLSEEGIADLLSFFEARSRDERRQLWLVDHRSLKAGNFDGEVRIDKTPDHGSVIRGLRTHYGVQS